MDTSLSMLTPHSVPLINRERSILAFQERVLAQAKNPQLPLLERLKFIAIVASNIDEFFEVRMANMQEQIQSGLDRVENQSAHEWRLSIQQYALYITKEQHRLFFDDLLPLLAHEHITLLDENQWSDAQHEWLYHLFMQNMLPVFTPIALDLAHPFPHITNKSLNFIVDLKGVDAYGRNIDTAILPIPENLPHIIELPSEDGATQLTTIQSVMAAFVSDIFPGLEILGLYQFRATRNSHLYIDKEELTNLHQALRGELKQRGFGHAVRLEIDDSCPAHLKHLLLKEFGLAPEDLYALPHYFDFSQIYNVLDYIDKKPHLVFEPIERHMPGRWEKRRDAFSEIDRQDILLHHPYDRFLPVVDFLREASEDPDVRVIRMTVYRTGDDSELMELLVRAARLGKEVNVVVELMARFDEATNLSWASRLEEAGVKIVYGVFGYKTHAKMLLVIREQKNHKGENYLRRYAHVGTGNYHQGNARLYTDFSLLTSNKEITASISEIFLNLSSLAKIPKLKTVWQSPFNFIDRLLEEIEFEMNEVKAGRKGRIVARMNALMEPIVITALYNASQVGVEIDLIVRGACALKPGIPGLSENIRVRSIVGRFLEHSRVYYFYHGGKDHTYISSADWMNRNFFRRIEIAVPVFDKVIREQLIEEGLLWCLEDQSAWCLDGETGHYHQAVTIDPQTSLQHRLIQKRLR
ncbi:polyphosphate kinase 1 [Wohlfahrtiimonas chitiniclastica]|uniref:polyphosphate kinase 1 n=1 Tax=Wohlfahrtiimonas chitiniclastica TaxID=400946 RepID=UPI000AC133B9|nr:polyphosphate kinase 1 [Wohlfahrtiimonas chitiniclastica]